MILFFDDKYYLCIIVRKTTVIMRKIYVALFTALLCLLSLSAHAQRGEKSVGLLGGFNTESESGLAGVFFQYSCNSWLRLTPNIQAIFKKNDVSAMHINGNAHFILQLTDDLYCYALGGVTYQSWRLPWVNDDWKIEHENINRFGANVGGGLEIYATPSLKFMVEGKYSFVKDFSSAGFVAGIGYVF